MVDTAIQLSLKENHILGQLFIFVLAYVGAGLNVPQGMARFLETPSIAFLYLIFFNMIIILIACLGCTSMVYIFIYSY